MYIFTSFRRNLASTTYSYQNETPLTLPPLAGGRLDATERQSPRRILDEFTDGLTDRHRNLRRDPGLKDAWRRGVRECAYRWRAELGLAWVRGARGENRRCVVIHTRVRELCLGALADGA